MQNERTPSRRSSSTASGKRVSFIVSATINGCWVCHTKPLGESSTLRSMTSTSIRCGVAMMCKRILLRAGSCKTSQREVKFTRRGRRSFRS
jgi:hypothetical protein